jgi:hypothetical protein
MLKVFMGLEKMNHLLRISGKPGTNKTKLG